MRLILYALPFLLLLTAPVQAITLSLNKQTNDCDIPNYCTTIDGIDITAEAYVSDDGLGVKEALDLDPHINNGESIKLTFSKPVYISFVTLANWQKLDSAQILLLDSTSTPIYKVDFFQTVDTSGFLKYGINYGLEIYGLQVVGVNDETAFYWSSISYQVADVSAVPLPAALPLYGVGMGFLGLMGWRRKRKQNCA